MKNRSRTKNTIWTRCPSDVITRYGQQECTPSSGAALRTIGRCLFTIRFYCNHDQLKVYSYGLFPLFLSVYTTTGPITYKYYIYGNGANIKNY